MKRSLNWHKTGLGSMRRHLDQERRRLETITQNFKSLQDQVGFYELQISTAEKEGKDGFDAQAYLVKRKNKP